ncbi:HAMP domain-containing protein [Alcanivorax sp. 24]|uniref:HAMP domain-containing protein n=1 Tax=Alcanivorax sp. 24 TaxID=2545266 RepID=UPI0014151CE6|nr:HAMP domain-containing protein [Alcanivorax sp. 24]
MDWLRTAFVRYRSIGEALARAAIGGPVSMAVGADEFDRMRRLEGVYEQAHNEFEQERYRSFRETLNARREDNQGPQLIGLALGSLAFALLGLIALRVTRTITRLLEDAVSAADSIADGDWDTEISSESRDETGRLICAIRKMRQALRDVIAAFPEGP